MDRQRGISLLMQSLIGQVPIGFLIDRWARWEHLGVDDIVIGELYCRTLAEDHKLGCKCTLCIWWRTVEL